MSQELQCVEHVTGSNITVKEKGRRANFKNPNNASFQRVRVDDCLITEGPRADWIINKIGVGSVVIELKGKGVEYACKQLSATVIHPNVQPWLQSRKALLVMCSRYPKFDTIVAKATAAARSKGMKLFVACNDRDFVLEDLL
ncbi:hypothetical protein [Sphingosinicella sp.]|uniref:hypothetical protein n=1 Tax=Sphingosinicella sp. TaxID=1917971 RepID=UPI00183BE54C|nr:hypothetical protein [Sphingosinicella sp.]MBA4757850.1 hypothetical protein [Sphingosinicella sp.]